MTVAYNPLSEEYRADPYAHYAALRREDPVHYSVLFRAWVLTRHADVATVLRDPRFSADHSAIDHPALRLPMPRPELRALSEALHHSMLFADPPDHTRLRNLVSKAFTPRIVEAQRAHVAAVVGELLDAVESRTAFDVIRDFAYPLPVTIIAGILGVPPEDREHFKRWSDDLALLLDPFVPEAVFERAQDSALALYEYLRGVFAARRRAPRDDLVSALLAAEEQGDVLSEVELFATCALLLGGGHETTTNLIGNGILTLARHPNERDRLARDPGLLRTAIDELLRYESPTQVTARVASETCTIGSTTIRAGDLVVLGLGAANRDPEVFRDPDRLDLGRTDNRHLALSSGPHACLGAALARLEGQIAIGTLLARHPRLHVDADVPDWHPTVVSRGLRTLPALL